MDQSLGRRGHVGRMITTEGRQDKDSIFVDDRLKGVCKALLRAAKFRAKLPVLVNSIAKRHYTDYVVPCGLHAFQPYVRSNYLSESSFRLLNQSS